MTWEQYKLVQHRTLLSVALDALAEIEDPPITKEDRSRLDEVYDALCGIRIRVAARIQVTEGVED